MFTPRWCYKQPPPPPLPVVVSQPTFDPEFEATCQHVMRMNCGMDLREWVALLHSKLEHLLATGVPAGAPLDCPGLEASLEPEGGQSVWASWYSAFSVREALWALEQVEQDPFVAHVVVGDGEVWVREVQAAARAAL